MTEQNSQWGILAEFHDQSALLSGCENLRDAGFKKWDAHTPFPIHALDKAMGLKPTPLPWISLIAALIGLITTTSLVFFVHSYDYPLVLSGKPFFAWPAYVPVIFAVTILFSAVSTGIAVLFFSGLPQFHHPLFSSKQFEFASDNRFFISIEKADPKYHHEKTLLFLREIGAKNAEYIDA